MIVNRYDNTFRPKLTMHTAETFFLWSICALFNKYLPEKKKEKYLKWLKKRYEYQEIKWQTEECLKKSYDKGEEPLFSSVEIEVINRCNGNCPFCPVNRDIDPRIMKRMDTELFYKIINELGELDYRGRLALHSNNEPFLDDRIIDFAKYAREHVPHAFLYMYTNGTLLTIEKFNEIIPYLDRMVIDNYDDELKLHDNSKKINEICRKNGRLNRKVEIHVRKIHEVLNTRGGQSPNNNKRATYSMSCILPFKQLIIRPDGKISLCCNDPYGKYTLADLTKTSLQEAWYSDGYKAVRNRLRKGRKNIELCRFCDTMPGPSGY